MTDIPAMLLWTDAYMADTSHLTTVEHGAYLLLLMAMWRAGGSLPNDDVRLARIAKLSLDKWRKVAPNVMEFMTVDGQSVTQKRLKLEFEIASGKAEKLAAAGRAGGRAKALKNLTRKSSDAKETLEANGCGNGSGGLPNQTPETNDQLTASSSLRSDAAAAPRESAGEEISLPSAEHLCRQALGDASPVDPVIGPMMPVLKEFGIPRTVEILRAEAMRPRTRPIRTWKIWADIVRERAPDYAPGQPRGSPSGKPDMYAALEESKRILAARQGLNA